MKKYLSLAVSAALPLFLFSWFAPTPANQLDFWLMWLTAMLVLAIPMVYAEVALANRSGDKPLTGIQKLTREADASVFWRGSVWFAILVTLMVTAHLVSGLSSAFVPILSQLGVEGIPTFGLMIGFMIIAVILSLFGSVTALIGLICALVGLVLSLINGVSDFSLQMTPLTLAEWGRAVMMALVSVGTGSGLYWLASFEKNIDDTNKKSATKTVLPIIAIQLVAGAIALTVASVKIGEPTQLASTVTAVGALFLSAALIHFARQVLSSRFGLIMALLITLLIGCVLVIIPTSVLLILLVIVVSISTFLLSVFTGWLMKISHLRKSMNFNSEGSYNIWRIAIRILVPIAIVVGLIGWIQAWIG